MTDAPKRKPGQQGTTKAERQKLPPCGAKHNKRPGTCKRPAGWGTDHPGEGRCKLHGGTTQKPSGRYVQVNARPRLRELIAQFAADPDPHNLLHELTLLRALVTDYIERYDETTEALLNWHASFGSAYEQAVQEWRHDLADWTERRDQGDEEPPPIPIPAAFEQKPRQMVDIVSASGFIDKIGALSERIEKRRREGLISLALMDATLERMGMEVVHAAKEVGIHDTARTALLAAIERRWNDVRVDPASGTVQGAEAGGRGTLN